MAMITSTGSGLFSAGGTWIGGVPPANLDGMTIANTHVVSFDVDMSGWANGLAASVVNAGGTLSILNDGTVTYLKMAGDLTINGALSIGTAVAPIPAAPGAAASPAVATIAFNGAFSLKAGGGTLFEAYGEERAGQDYTAQAQIADDSVITLTTGFTLRDPDRIIITRAVAGANATIHTVQAYNAGTKVVTLTAPLGRAVAIDDRVILLSRCIDIRTLTDEATVLASAPAGSTIKGVRIYGGGVYLVYNISTLTAEYCTAESTVGDLDTWRGCSSGTFRYCHTYYGRSVCYAMSGSLLENCINVRTPFLAYGSVRIKLHDCETWNHTVAGLAIEGEESECVDCLVAWCSSGLFSGGLYIAFRGCTALGCTNGALVSESKECVLANCTTSGGGSDIFRPQGNITLYNCDLASATEVSQYLDRLGPRQRILSFDHDQTADNVKAWTLGGVHLTQAGVKPVGHVRAYQLDLESATYPCFMDWPFMLDADATVNIDIWVYVDALGLTDRIRAQIIDPKADSLIDDGAYVNNAADVLALDEHICVNTATTWFTDTLTYLNPTDAPIPLILRFRCTDAGNNAYYDFDVQAGGAGVTGLMAAYGYGLD